MASLSEVLAGEEEEEGLRLRPAGFGAAMVVVMEPAAIEGEQQRAIKAEEQIV